MAKKRFLYLVTDGGSPLSQIFSEIGSDSSIDVYYDDTITNVPDTSKVFRYVAPLKDDTELMISPGAFLEYVKNAYSVDQSEIIFYLGEERHKKFSQYVNELIRFGLPVEHGFGDNVLLYVFDI